MDTFTCHDGHFNKIIKIKAEESETLSFFIPYIPFFCQNLVPTLTKEQLNC